MKRRPVITLLFSAVILLSPIAGVVGATSGTATPAHSLAASDGTDDSYVDVTENMSVWDRSVLSLRTDSSASGAVTVDNLVLDAQTPRGDVSSGDLNRPTLAVFQTGNEVTLSFGDGVDTSNIPTDDAQLLTAHLEEEASATPTTGRELLSELSNENIDNLNQNASFTDKRITLSGDQELTVTPDKPGHYVYVLATGGNLSTSNGDLEISGETTVLGVEQLAAQDSPSDVTVSPTSPEPSDEVTFDVNATELEGDTSHAVAVYDKSTFTTSQMTVNISEQLSTDLSGENVTIKHEIKEFNGIQNIEDNVSVFNQRIGEQTGTGLTQFGDVVSFIANEGNVDGIETDVTGETTLNASTTAVKASPETAVTVETYQNWTEGDYRWVHIATGSSSDAFQVNTGTVTIEDYTSGDDDGGGGGGGDGGFVDEPDGDTSDGNESEQQQPNAAIAIDPNPATVNETVTFSATKSTDETQDSVDYEWKINNGTFEGKTVTRTFNEPGEYPVELTVRTEAGETDTATATLTVEKDTETEPDGPDQPDEPEDDGGFPIPGFGVGVAIAALLSVALLLSRRQT
ncbi:PKD domain-containing protein [Natrinema gari]|nr:PKD domain-containing protein [Natrinema gari]